MMRGKYLPRSSPISTFFQYWQSPNKCDNGNQSFLSGRAPPFRVFPGHHGARRFSFNFLKKRSLIRRGDALSGAAAFIIITDII